MATIAAIVGVLVERMHPPRLNLRSMLAEHAVTILAALGVACLAVALGWLVALLGS